MKKTIFALTITIVAFFSEIHAHSGGFCDAVIAAAKSLNCNAFSFPTNSNVTTNSVNRDKDIGLCDYYGVSVGSVDISGSAIKNAPHTTTNNLTGKIEPTDQTNSPANANPTVQATGTNTVGNVNVGTHPANDSESGGRLDVNTANRTNNIRAAGLDFDSVDIGSIRL